MEGQGGEVFNFATEREENNLRLMKPLPITQPMICLVAPLLAKKLLLQDNFFTLTKSVLRLECR